MYSITPSGRNHRAPAFRDEGLALSRRSPLPGHDDLSDCISRGRRGNVDPSRSGRHVRTGCRNGGEYGWSRQGRVRLESSLFLRDPDNPPGRFFRRHDDLSLNRDILKDIRDNDSEQTESVPSGLNALPYLLGEHHPSSLQYGPNLLLEDGLRDREPYFRGALALPDIDRGSPTASLDSVSEYSLRHMDRLGRPYHYQPPYVEDYESQLDEELVGQPDGLDSLHDRFPPSEFSGLLTPRRRLLPDPRPTRRLP
jgi:hypothetical protein